MDSFLKIHLNRKLPRDANRRFSVNLALVILFLSVSLPAQAQIFSPGTLSDQHAEIEGLSNCVKCHPVGGRLSPKLCLDCHKEISTRIDKKKGYHGLLPPGKQQCNKCHYEHRGLKAKLIIWDKDKFDHNQTGYRLTGEHKDVKCAECHDPRLIVDAKIKKLLSKPKKKETFLGSSTRCASCHFDEHRGQFGKRKSIKCEQCHTTKPFKDAPKFDHAKTNFALLGKHQDVKCLDCHPKEPDPNYSANAFPKPRANTFSRFQPVEHDQCTACHEDPHEGRFGPQCTDCHSELGWNKIKAKGKGQKKDFHDETRYPLRGKHRAVDCKSCHLPLGKKKQVFKGLPFAQCADCHLDAHQKQVGMECENCHTVQGFVPSTFDLAAHAKTSYPLDGAHQAVPCIGCHPDSLDDPRISRRLRKQLKKSKREWLYTGIDFDIPSKNCSDCHDNPHGRQFDKEIKAGGCETCHVTESFTENLKFDHNKDSRFALEGAHATTDCDGCHVKPKKGPVVYKPLTMDCQGCHKDIHFAQFKPADAKVSQCDSCHNFEAFKPAKKFDHNNSRFALKGKHMDVSCDKCHKTVKIGNNEVTRYKPMSIECAGCHQDFHNGAMEKYQ